MLEGKRFEEELAKGTKEWPVGEVENSESGVLEAKEFNVKCC